MEEVRFSVPEITCGGCVETLRKSISVLPGIQSVTGDVEARRIAVSFDAAKTDAAAIRERIERAGFDLGEEGGGDS